MPDLEEYQLPVVWSLVRGALSDAPAPIARDVLIDRLTPAGLISRERKSDSRHVGPSLRALESFGVVAGGRDGLRLATPAAGEEERFRLEVARRMLRLPGDEGLWAENRGGGLVHQAQAAVAWLCLQGFDCRAGRFDETEPLLRRQFGADRTLLRSDVTYNALVRLALWLGVAGALPAPDDGFRLMPDPTPLLRTALDDLLAPGEAVSAATLLERIGAIFPWLPHGPIGRAVAERMTIVPDDGAREGRISACLSLALTRLRMEGALSLDAGDDTRQRIGLSLPGGATASVARVVRR
jgi:hypothetical protein